VPPEVKAARKAIVRAVEAIAEDLASDDGGKRDSAQNMLRELNESVMSEVLARVDLGDPAKAAAAADLFKSLAVSARQGAMLVTLPSEHRKAVVTLAKEKPKHFCALFSLNPTEAVRGLRRVTAGDKVGAEPIALWALHHPDWRVRITACKTAAKLARPSKQVKDTMFKRLSTLPIRSRHFHFGDGEDDVLGSYTARRISSDERKAVLEALVGMKDRRILPVLLKTILARGSDFGPGTDSDDVARLILKMDDKRTVPTLMDYIDNDRQITSITYGSREGVKVTIKVGDLAMGLIVQQTGQTLKDYGFYCHDDWGPSSGDRGFTSGAARTAARKKLRAWWKQHENEYAGVEKISLLAGPPPPKARGTLPDFIKKLGGL